MYGWVDFWQVTKIQLPKSTCEWMCGPSWLKDWLISNSHKDFGHILEYGKNMAKVKKGNT
jgi:hypothetical protein